MSLLQVRSVWYRLAFSLCQKLPREAFNTALDQGGKKGSETRSLGSRLSTSITSRLEEKEASAVGAAWDAALALVDSVPDWHEHSSPEKVVLPRVRAVLRAGAHGCGTDVYPKLLPLLARTPDAGEMSRALLAGTPTWITEGLMVQEEAMEASPTGRMTSARGAAETKQGIRAFFECQKGALKRFPHDKENVEEPVVKLVSACAYPVHFVFGTKCFLLEKTRQESP